MNAFGNKEFVPDYPEGTGYYMSNSLKGGAADFSFGYGRAGDEATQVIGMETVRTP